MSLPKLPALEEALNAEGPTTAYLLVDGALSPDIVRQPPLGVETAGLQVPGVDDAESKAVLPMLMAWPDDALTRRWLLPRSVRWAQEHCAVTWLRSRLGLEELAQALGHRMDGRLEDGTEVLLRFADARILAPLYRALDDNQRATMFAPIEQWWFLDRQERLQSLPLGQPGKGKPGSPPLRLAQGQLDKLLEEAEPDVVLMLLTRMSLKELAALDRVDRYSFAKTHVEQARQLGMTASIDFAAYCIIALMHGESVFASNAWTDLVRRVRNGELKWPKAMASFEP